MTEEEAAVVAKREKEQRRQMILYGGAGAAMTGIAGLAIWGLNAADKAGRKQAGKKPVEPTWVGITSLDWDLDEVGNAHED